MNRYSIAIIAGGVLLFSIVMNLITPSSGSLDRLTESQHAAVRSSFGLMLAEQNAGSDKANSTSIPPLHGRALQDFCEEPGDDPQTLAQLLVEELLVAPASAEFGLPTVANPSGCEFTVYGNVDSQNGFGAMIRSRYSVSMRFDPSSRKWTDFEYSLR